MSKNKKILFLTHTTDPTTGGWGRYTHDIAQGLEKKGFQVFSLDKLCAPIREPLEYLRNPLVIFFDFFKIRRCVREVNADIVHITVEPYVFFVPFLPRGPKVYMTVHGSYAFTPNQTRRVFYFFYKMLFHISLKRISRFISVSEFTKEHLKGCLKLREYPPVDVVFNGINVEAYTVGNRKKTEKKRILTVAPTKGRKGILESVKSVILFAKEKSNPRVEYHIVGSYDPESSYFRKVANHIKDAGMQSSIFFLRELSDADLLKEYQEADVFLMLPIIKTNNQFEGFGLVYLEANACGVPTIGSSIGGSAEAIKDGVSGILVDPYNADDVMLALQDVLCKNVITSSGARLWAEEHSIDLVADQVKRMYDISE